MNKHTMEEEFTEILYKHQGIVHKICHLYFHDRVDKDDYKQELIIQIWKAYPKFKQQSKFSTWMYRVCLNAAIDILRKEKAQPTFVKQDLESTLSESHNESNNNRELLYQAINRLSVIDKAIITLYLEEFSYKEISDIMGISGSLPYYEKASSLLGYTMKASKTFSFEKETKLSSIEKRIIELS